MIRFHDVEKEPNYAAWVLTGNKIVSFFYLKGYFTYHGVRAIDGPGPDFVEGLFGQVGSLVSLLKLGLGLSKLGLVQRNKIWFNVNLLYHQSVILAAVVLKCSKEPIPSYSCTFVIKSVICSE